MPNAAAPIAPRTASFLAISAPVASEKPSDEGFAAVLADKTAPVETKKPAETGKRVPTPRQDLAAPADALPAKPVKAHTEDDDADLEVAADETAEAIVPMTTAPILALLPRPITVELVQRPEPVQVTLSDVKAVTTPAVELPMFETPPAEKPAVKAAAPTSAEPKTAPAINSVTFLMQRVATVAPAPVTPQAPVAAAPAPVAKPAEVATDITSGIATIEQPVIVETQIAVETTVQAEPVQIAEAPVVPIENKAAKPEAPAARAAAPQPIVEARGIALAKAISETVSEPAAAKPKARTTASTLEALGMTTSASAIELRTVTAATASASIETLPQERATALIETIQSLRSEMKGDALDLSIDHKDYGPINVRFDRAEHGVTVRFDTRDADVAKLIADSTSALKAAGEQQGFRFERRETAGAGTSSQDGSRQGQTPARIAETILSNPSSPTRSTEDRSGIYA